VVTRLLLVSLYNILVVANLLLVGFYDVLVYCVFYFVSSTGLVLSLYNVLGV